MKENIILALKGFVMGIANIIPGVSGGTLAITLGFYEKLIGAISHFFSNLKENIKFLLPLGIGMILAILSMSRVIDYAYDHFPIPTMLFFVGLVIGGIPLIARKVKGKKEAQGVSNYLIFVIPFIIVILLASSELLFHIDMSVNLNTIGPVGYILLFLVGMIAAATMIIPGVSGSLVLMMLGYYRPILKVLKDLTSFNNLEHNILIAGVFAIGILVGIVLISKLIEWLFKKYEVKTYFGVLGFICASVIAIPISTVTTVSDLRFSVLQIIIGIIVLLVGTLIGNKLGDE